MQEKEEVRKRIANLREYLKNVEQQIPDNFVQQKQDRMILSSRRNEHTPPHSREKDRLLNEIQILQTCIAKKREMFEQRSNQTQKILRDPTKPFPLIVSAYVSRVVPQGSLSAIIQNIEPEEWTKSCIYLKKRILIMITENNLEIIKLDLTTIGMVQIHKKSSYLKFTIRNPGCFLIIAFPPQKIQVWYTFLKNHETFSKNNSLIWKWRSTGIRCKVKEQNEKVKDEVSEQIKINIKNQERKEEKVRKYSVKVSEIRRNQVDNFQSQIEPVKKMVKQHRKSEGFFQQIQSKNERISIQVEHKKSKQFLEVPVILNIKQKPQIEEKRVILSKLQEKRKKLLEQEKFLIHWDQNDEKSHHSIDQKEKISIKPRFSHKTTKQFGSFQSPSNQESRVHEKNSTKRNDTKTNQQLDEEKSISHGKTADIFGRGSHHKRYTEYRSQQFEGLSGSSATKKRSIRKEVLRALADKQSEIKEVMSKNSKSSDGKKKAGSSRKSISTRIKKIHFNKDEESMNPKNSKQSQLQNQSDEDSYLSSSDGNSSQFSQIDLHELKSGIVLWKCAVKGWNPHQKRLYLGQSQFQICYCDIIDEREEKKFFFRDIIKIQYGREGNGIIKHFGTKIDLSRCLIITTETNGKVKELQFYLGETEGHENLEQFAKKLNIYLVQKKMGDNEDDEGFQ